MKLNILLIVILLASIGYNVKQYNEYNNLSFEYHRSLGESGRINEELKYHKANEAQLEKRIHELEHQ